MKERFGAKNERSMWMRFHSQTAGCSLTEQQPEVNLIRTTIQALAAVLGGTQSLHTNSLDEAIALPSEKAARLALRTQQVIAHESGVTNTVDPLGGSYFVEALTAEMERECFDYFEKIDALGGCLPAIEAGFFQKEIAEASWRYQREIDTKERVIVGVNAYQVEEPLEWPILRIDREGERRHLARLNRVRAERDQSRVAETLERLRQACADGRTNTMPYLLEAVHAYATLGEIMGVMRAVFGEHKETVIV
jgi:methylmalonyl-CoA mutase N-terminal domain/subunit